MTAVPSPRLMQIMAGPVLWAVLFSAVYALHGFGCAAGWPAVNAPFGGSFHVMALMAAVLAGLVLHAGLVLLARNGPAEKRRANLYSAWFSLAASLLTLSPVFFTSTCMA